MPRVGPFGGFGHHLEAFQGLGHIVGVLFTEESVHSHLDIYRGVELLE
jgi:hypothetical protein